MEILVLGTLQVTRDGAPVYLRTGRKPRLVLAVLMSRAGQVVSTDALLAAVWGDLPPTSARRNLQQYIQQVRAAVGADRLVREGEGYAVVADDAMDAVRFRRLHTAGDAALAGGDLADASRTLRAGLDLWRGPAFTEFLDCPAVAQEAAGLEQSRVDAYERWAQAELALGRHSGLITELAEQVREHPYREGLCARLMLALYRGGRQAEALQTFRETRALLRGQLGVEPGRELQQLHQAMLRGNDAPRLVAATGRVSGGVPVPHELPSDVSGFTGRTQALRQLDAMLPTESTAGGEAVKYQRPVGPSSMQRIRETLRTALNDAIREELISFNAAKWVEMPPATRPRPVVWTPERVEHWQRTGQGAVAGDGVDRRANRPVPRPRHQRPALSAVPLDRLPRIFSGGSPRVGGEFLAFAQFRG